MKAAIYDLASGAICSCFDGAADRIWVQPGQGWIAGEANDATDYVNLDADPVITPKGDYTLESLPLPCTVTIEGVEYACTEQPTFQFNYPGTYKVKVDAGTRYLVKEFEIVWP